MCISILTMSGVTPVTPSPFGPLTNIAHRTRAPYCAIYTKTFLVISCLKIVSNQIARFISQIGNTIQWLKWKFPFILDYGTQNLIYFMGQLNLITLASF